MFEHKSKPVTSLRVYARRQLWYALLSGVVVMIALGIGVVGYRALEHRSWVDSLYSAAMILTGMGPAFEMKTDTGKLFASAYAIFSAAIFLTAASIMISPALHRVLHRLHMEEQGE